MPYGIEIGHDGRDDRIFLEQALGRRYRPMMYMILSPCNLSISSTAIKRRCLRQRARPIAAPASLLSLTNVLGE